MGNLDKLRGTPEGYTASSKNKLPRHLRKAAMMASALLSVAPLSAQAENTEQNPQEVLYGVRVRYSEEQKAMMEAEQKMAQKQMEDRYGVDGSVSLNHEDISINFNADSNTYEILGTDGSLVNIPLEDMNHAKMSRQAQKDHKEHYSKPAEISFYEEANSGIGGVYNVQEHKIKINTISTRPEGLLSDDEHISFIIDHEKSHAEDYQDKDFSIEQFYTQGQCLRKGFDSEIKANINSSAMLLEKYSKTGDVKCFDALVNVSYEYRKEFKSWIEANKDKANTQECKTKLAAAIHDGWLDLNNHPHEYYFNNEANNAINRYNIGSSETKALDGADEFYNIQNDKGFVSPSAIVENQANIDAYLKMQKEMFQDTALGDVSSVCCGYVKIGAGCEMQEAVPRGQTQQAKNFIQKMAEGASTIKGVMRNMNKYLKVVKKAGKDGDITVKEQIKINNMVEKVCKEDSKAGAIIASKTGRGWNKNTSKNQTDKSSVENTQINTNVVLAQQDYAR